MEEPIIKACDNCKHSHEYASMEYPEYLQCRAHPPVMFIAEDNTACWSFPSVGRYCYCGEWKPERKQDIKTDYGGYECGVCGSWKPDRMSICSECGY